MLAWPVGMSSTAFLSYAALAIELLLGSRWLQKIDRAPLAQLAIAG